MLYTLAASLALLIGPLPQGARRATPPTMSNSESLNFLNPDQCRDIKAKVGTPCFVYDEATLKRQATTALSFPNAYGLTVRFAMKASPNAAILKTFDSLGLHIDASSGFEVRRAVAAGISAEKMSLSSQETPHDLGELLDLGIKFNACSLKQLEAFGKLRKGDRSDQLGVRFNPGLGSGGTGKTNVGGPASSFGIWHELMPEVKAILAKYDLEPARVHAHRLGLRPRRVAAHVRDVSRPRQAAADGEDPQPRRRVQGGADVDRDVDRPRRHRRAGARALRELRQGRRPRAQARDRAGHLPRRQLRASLLTTVQDVVSTGGGGFDFLKLDSGMTELLRPSLYGSQHPAVLVPHTAGAARAADGRKYVAVGHCCESGDLVTPEPDEAETLGPRALGGEAQDGDLLVIEGAGAYCSSMCTKNYNSFPEAPEVMLDGNGAPHIIRKKQPVEEIWQNEVAYP